MLQNVMKTCIALFGKDYKYTVSKQSQSLTFGIVNHALLNFGFYRFV